MTSFRKTGARVLAFVAVGVVGLTTLNGAATAAGGDSLTFSPAAGKPGDKVTVKVSCADGWTARAIGATGQDPLGISGLAKSEFSGKVQSNAADGKYTYYATCEGDNSSGNESRRVNAVFTVNRGTSAKPSHPSTKPEVAKKPQGGVETGGGGTAVEAAVR
ncbi:hypothetical protein [Amycolatopsis sp. cmx-4-61]|uniref:hypothetical protein n=1 Tax=Amycolatopsis sp. cmx-4-61 TaxID=2790937 RepID=UPI003977F2B2